jgi:hypothetical protein
VAILAAIAYASYQGQITKSRRASAAGCLQERAQFRAGAPGAGCALAFGPGLSAEAMRFTAS